MGSLRNSKHEKCLGDKHVSQILIKQGDLGFHEKWIKKKIEVKWFLVQSSKMRVCVCRGWRWRWCESVVSLWLFKQSQSHCSTVSTTERRCDTSRCPWVTYSHELSMRTRILWPYFPYFFCYHCPCTLICLYNPMWVPNFWIKDDINTWLLYRAHGRLRSSYLTGPCSHWAWIQGHTYSQHGALSSRYTELVRFSFSPVQRTHPSSPLFSLSRDTQGILTHARHILSCQLQSKGWKTRYT